MCWRIAYSEFYRWDNLYLAVSVSERTVQWRASVLLSKARSSHLLYMQLEHQEDFFYLALVCLEYHESSYRDCIHIQEIFP